MKRTMSIVVSLFAVAALNAETIISTDFGKSEIAIADKLKRENSNISGKCPEGWSDDSHFNKSTVVYEPTEEGGDKFLRISVPEPGSGKPGAFVNLNLPEMKGKTSYTMKFRLRNPGQTIVRLAIRMKEKPWTMLADKSGKFTGDWADYEAKFVIDQKDTPIGVWIVMPVGSVLDLKSFELSSEPVEEKN